MSLALFSAVSIFFFYIIFSKRNFIFGFKESFAIGLFFYIYIPIIIFYLYHDFLLSYYLNFYGYDNDDILKIQYLTIILIISFFLGYISLKKKVRIFNLNQNFSAREIILTIFIVSLTFFFRIPAINPVILLYTLICILIFKSDSKNIRKIIFFMIIGLFFMYLSINFSNARRHVIVIFMISMFFVSLFLNSKKNFFLIFLISLIAGIFFVLLVTHLRSIQISGIEASFNFHPSLGGIISNYDFMSAFDNLVYILNVPDYLYGQTVFKIFYSFIPRDIWPSKPLDTNLLIVSLRQNPFVGGSSQSVTLLGEIFWNFGWIGTFLFFYLIGGVAKNFDLIKQSKLFDSQLIFLASMVYLIFIFWRGSISTSLVSYILNLSFLFITLFISKFIFRRRKN